MVVITGPGRNGHESPPAWEKFRRGGLIPQDMGLMITENEKIFNPVRPKNISTKEIIVIFNYFIAKPD